jgi:hypothetical protein
MSTPADQGPSRPSPISPDRLRRLLDGAAQAVYPPSGAYDRIQQGVRRRRSVHRFGAALLAVATLAGGSAAVLAAAAASAPARLAATPAPSAVPVPATSAAYATSDGAYASAAGPVAIRAICNGNLTSHFLLTARTVSSGPQSISFTVTQTRDMPAAAPVVVGSADAAGDGATEIFVLVNEGCCKQVWTIFRLVNGHLAQVSLRGRPVELTVGDTVGSSGFSCDGAAHELLVYGYRPGGRAGPFLATYRWAGASLVPVSRQRAQHLPDLTRFTDEVSCGALPQYAA